MSYFSPLCSTVFPQWQAEDVIIPWDSQIIIFPRRNGSYQKCGGSVHSSDGSVVVAQYTVEVAQYTVVVAQCMVVVS